MVRDDDSVDTAVPGALGVLGCQHALDEQRQRDPFSQPDELVPGEAEIRERREHLQGSALRVLLGWSLQPLAKDGVGEELGTAFAAHERQIGILQVARSPPEDRQIERDHDGAVTDRGRTMDEAQGDLSVVNPIELEPARRVSHRVGDLFDRMRGSARKDERDAGRCRRARHRQLALWMRNAQHAHRRQQKRCGRVGADDLGRQIAFEDSSEHARPEPPTLEGFSVHADRQFGACSSRDVTERGRLDRTLCSSLPVRERNRPFARPRHVDGVLELRPVEGHGSATLTRSLPRFSPRSRPMNAARRFFQAFDNVFAIAEVAIVQPARKARQCRLVQVRVVGDEKSFNPRSTDDRKAETPGSAVRG